MPRSSAADVVPMRALMAGGQPISDAVADRAAEWLTLLMSGEATDTDWQNCQQWRTEHPDHERAWAHIEAVTQRFKVMEPRAGYQALSPYAGQPEPGRRQVVKLLMWGGVAGATGVLASRTTTWQYHMADYRTGIGEQRTIALSDGTQLTLDTASAVNVSFDGQRRLLQLVAGEVLIVTGHALPGDARVADPRPLVVETAEGSIRALGTRFTVRQWAGHSSTAVLESAVEISPAFSRLPITLRAGERTSFSRTTAEPASPLQERDSIWSRGQIVAGDMALGDFLAELGRYRPGVVRCDPAVARLRFSGVFPLHDTDRILAALPQVLPVRLRQRTRYWVTVEASPGR